MADEESPASRSAREAREQFDDAFEDLLARSNRSALVDRETASFDDIVADHAEVEDARRFARDAKLGIVSRYEPPIPDHVEQPLGPQDTSMFGRVVAILSAIAVLAVVPVVWFLFTNSSPWSAQVTDAIVVEGGGSGQACILELTVRVVNDDVDAIYEVTGMTAVIDRRVTAFVLAEGNPVLPTRVGDASVERVLGFSHAVDRTIDDRCPTVDEVGRGSTTLTLRPAPGQTGPLVSVGVE